MSERWLYEEQGDPDSGYLWNVMLNEGGKLRCFAQCFSEQDAENVISALKNLDAWEACMGTLAMEGIAIDANSGKIWSRDPKQKSFDVKIEKPRTRAKRPR